MLVQIQEHKQKQKVKLSQLLKNATEEQCFGRFMKVSETADLDEDHKPISTKSMVKVCVNGLLISKAGIGDESSTALMKIFARRIEL
jgi:hypothetical protein